MERTTRTAAALFVLVGGIVHLQLWRSGYRSVPSIGPLFLANGIVSAGLALALVARRSSAVAAVGAAFSVAAVGALVMSRTVGVLGFVERAWTDQAVQATAAAIGAVVALAVAGAAARPPRADPAVVAAVPVPAGRPGRR